MYVFLCKGQLIGHLNLLPSVSCSIFSPQSHLSVLRCKPNLMTAVGWNWCEAFQTFSAPWIWRLHLPVPTPSLFSRPWLPGSVSLFFPRGEQSWSWQSDSIRRASYWICLKISRRPYPLPSPSSSSSSHPSPRPSLLPGPAPQSRLSSTFRPIKTYNGDERAKQGREEDFLEKKIGFCCFF